jgi:hypothetical protein
MKSSESKEYLAFDYRAIRLMIGLIAIFFPLVVRIFASKITDSISWAYHTSARDFYVGFLFVIGAFLISYKGHKHTLHIDHVGRFWNWLSSFWKGATNFRIYERKYEEDLVGWIGGIAAWVAAIFPIARSLKENSSYDTISYIHYIAAIILFSTTVYFCLVAFSTQAKDKIKNEDKLSRRAKLGPRQLRLKIYSFCGWGIAVIIVSLIIVTSTELHKIKNITFWMETSALELFGFAWLIASQYLPVFTDKMERRKK